MSLPSMLAPARRWAQPSLTLWGLHGAADAERLALARYTATVATSNVRNAGTSARVFLEVTGANGTCAPQALENAPTNFQRGATDLFTWEDTDVGPLQTIRVWHDGSGTSPSWHLDLVEVDVTRVRPTGSYAQGTHCLLCLRLVRSVGTTCSDTAGWHAWGRC